MSRRLVSVLVVAAPLGVGAASAGFNAVTGSGGTVAAAPDWTAPSSSRSIQQKSQGGEPGYVRAGGTFHGYAQVDDSGNPASGTSQVSAESGLGSTPLTAGSYTAWGQTYNYRTGLVTMPAGTPEGTYPYSVRMTDAAGNVQTQSGFTTVVDNTVPTAGDVAGANRAGGIQSRIEAGDTLTLTYSEPIDPHSIVAGWTGASTSVVVRVNNTSPETMLVYNSTNTTQLPLGSVSLGRTDYVGANRTFGASGTPSTMQRSGNSVIVTLGTASGTTTTATGSGTLRWTPSGSAYDRAGNGASTTAVNESGVSDRDF